MSADARAAAADALAAHRLAVTVDGHRLELAFADLPGADPSRGAILYLHGFIASRRHWRPVLERLRPAGWRQLALDLPGFGDSGQLPRPHRLSDYADAPAAFVRALGLRPLVVAHSFGGMVAADLAMRHPDALRGLVLVAPAGLPHPHHCLPGWVRWPLVREALIALLTTRALGAWYFRGVSGRLWGLTAQEVEDLRHGVRRCRELRRMREFYRMPGFLDALRRAAVPAALIWGEDDRVVPASDLPAVAEALAERLVGVVRLPGCGHLPMHERRDEFAAALADLLVRLRAAGEGGG